MPIPENDSSIRKEKSSFRSDLGPELFIETNSTRKETFGILVSFNREGKEVFRSLIWKILFSGITVLEWIILFKFLEKNMKKASIMFNVCLAGVLRDSSGTRKGAVDFSTRLRPLHKTYSSLFFRSKSKQTILELVNFWLEVPVKEQKDTFTFNPNWRKPNVKPKVPPFIGIGYNDKGSIGPDRPEGEPLSGEESWDSLSIEFFLSKWEDILDSSSPIVNSQL